MCEGKSVGLVRYPTTVLPGDVSKIVTTYCADNAHSVYVNNMEVLCHYYGVWDLVYYSPAVPLQTPECECDTGYHAANVGGKQICQGLLIEFNLEISTKHHE